MKSKKINGNWIMGAVLVVLLAVGTSGFAFRGGPGMGYGQATIGTATLTADQQEKIDAIQTKYQPQIKELEQKITAKQDELATARSNDKTTVAQLNALEKECYQLNRQYRSLLDKANDEVVDVAGPNYGNYFACNYMNGNHQHMGAGMYGQHMGSGMYGRHMSGGMYGQHMGNMMSGQNMPCNY